METHTNNPTKSIVLSLETLKKEYDTVLLQYNQVQIDYMAYLKQHVVPPCNSDPNSIGVTQSCYEDIWKKAGCTTPSFYGDWPKQQSQNTLIQDSFSWATMTDENHRKGCYGDSDPSLYTTATAPNFNINPKPLSDIKGQAFWGTGGLAEKTVSSIDECKSMCLSDVKCTGATYNPDKKYCWTRSGEGNPMPAMENDYAIIPTSVKYLNTLRFLNQRLTNINKNIQDAINEGRPIYEDQVGENKSQSVVLVDQLQILNDERSKIDDSLKGYVDLNESYKQTTITTNQQYYTYIIGFSIFLIVVIVLFKIMSSGNNTNTSNTSSGMKYFIIFILLSLFLVIYNSKN